MVELTLCIGCYICKQPIRNEASTSATRLLCENCIHEIYLTHPDSSLQEISTKQVVSTHEALCNTVVKDVIDYLDAVSGKVKCSNCVTPKSHHWCVDCKQNYCDNCSTRIHRELALRHHKILELAKRPWEPPRCSRHSDEVLKYWCEDCDQSICSDCRLEGHQGHPCKKIAEHASQIENETEKGLKDMESLVANNKYLVQESASKSNSACERSRSQIDKAMDILQAAITTRKQNLRKKMEEIKNSNTKDLQQFHETIAEEIRHLRVQQGVLKLLHENGDPVKFINAEKGFQRYINKKDEISRGLDIPLLRQCKTQTDGLLNEIQRDIDKCPAFRATTPTSPFSIAQNDSQLNQWLDDHRHELQWNLSEKLILERHVKMVAQALQNNHTLLELELRNNTINRNGIQYLTEALKENTTLTSIDLSSNAIDSRCIGDFALMLRKNYSIVYLNLSDNEIGNEGAHALEYALRENKTLKRLLLSKNNISDAGAKHLAKTLRNQRQLHELFLHHNSIGDTGADELATALAQNETLITLILSNNQIGNKGALAFSDNLRQNRTLKMLALQDNRIDETTKNQIIIASEENPRRAIVL